MVESISQTSPAASTVEDPWSETRLQEAIRSWELKPGDEQRLRIMQVKVKDVEHPWNEPHVILGFAFAGGWETTEERFRKMIQWRLDNNVDSLLTDYKPNRLLLDNSAIGFLKGYDVDGDPIYLERGGAVDVKGLLKRFPREELMRHAIWLREVQCAGAWIDEFERRQGRSVTNITVVYDLHGLNTSHLHPNVLGFFQELMQLTDDYYPGPIKRMVIIRSPTIFRFAWNTIKTFFSKESQEKMIFADSDYLTELGKYMDIDVLPPCINPNGTGETAIGMPKEMDCMVTIPDHIGMNGEGYTPAGSGISEAKPTNDTASLCSLTDESSSESEDESASVENPLGEMLQDSRVQVA